MSFETVKIFENKIAEFFGAPYAIAVDCCTHGVELCLRHFKVKTINVPKRTYLSIPFLANKLKTVCSTFCIYSNVADTSVNFPSIIDLG